MYPNDLHFEIASLRGQDMRNQAAHERLLRQVARPKPDASIDPRRDPRRDAAYRRLAATILGLDINTLSGALRSAHN